VSAGRLRDVQRERLAAAEEQLAAAADAVRDDHAIRVELPDTEVPSRRTVLSCVRVNVSLRDADDGASGSTAHTAMWGRAVDLALRGPERVALLGGNGSGKTTLLRVIAGALAPTTGDVTVGVAGVGWLPQRLDVLDDRCSVLDNVRRSAPSATVNELRARLAQLHFRGDRADQPAGTLSGGERFRAVLATLLCAQPPPQLLLLDEPTNNLDLRSVEQLAEALDTYRGALIVASHDVPFLHTIGVTRWLSLDRLDGLTETDPP
jgi:ATPase subunit of ABC transporter with duplicated ATPase domains